MIPEDVVFYKNTENRTSNAALIKAAFRAGFRSGVAFVNESETTNDAYWRSKDWKEFVKQKKIKP